uniref:Uncharacterized protein n=1 Tax=viral metagenome TaxID=1070528 RepID=A0A6C0HN39_9ZZZZ
MALYPFKILYKEYMDPDKFINIMVQIRDMIPLEGKQLIEIQEMTEKEKTELLLVMNEVIRSLVYIL